MYVSCKACGKIFSTAKGGNGRDNHSPCEGTFDLGNVDAHLCRRIDKEGWESFETEELTALVDRPAFRDQAQAILRGLGGKAQGKPMYVACKVCGTIVSTANDEICLNDHFTCEGTFDIENVDAHVCRRIDKEGWDSFEAEELIALLARDGFTGGALKILRKRGGQDAILAIPQVCSLLVNHMAAVAQNSGKKVYAADAERLIRFLEERGPPAAEALPLLRTLIDCDDHVVRVNSRLAINAIDPENPVPV